MRAIIASVLLLSAPAFAQQSVTDVPPDLLSSTLIRGWEVQPQSSTPEQQAQLALQWAQQPADIQARGFGNRNRTPGRSTVGLGGQ